MPSQTQEEACGSDPVQSTLMITKDSRFIKSRPP